MTILYKKTANGDQIRLFRTNGTIHGLLNNTEIARHRNADVVLQRISECRPRPATIGQWEIDDHRDLIFAELEQAQPPAFDKQQ